MRSNPSEIGSYHALRVAFDPILLATCPMSPSGLRRICRRAAGEEASGEGVVRVRKRISGRVSDLLNGRVPISQEDKLIRKYGWIWRVRICSRYQDGEPDNGEKLVLLLLLPAACELNQTRALGEPKTY